MSTPSTATATLPPHHQYYSHHQAYTPQSSSYGINGSLVNGAPRLPNHQYSSTSSYTAVNSTSSDTRRPTTTSSRTSARLPPPEYTYPAQQQHEMSSSRSARMARSVRSNRQPNWEEFYKNGIPKEIIVIDDDSPDPPRRNKTNPS